MSVDETRAIALLKGGDIGGLEWLVRAHQTQALRTAFLVVRDPALAEDVVQSSFLKAYDSIHHFDSNRPFAPWFLKIVSNAAIKALHQLEGIVPLDTGKLDASAPMGWQSISTPLPESLLEGAETSEELWTLLRDLPPEQRAVLILRYYADLTNSEIADDLGIPTGTVRWRLHAALQKLRGLIKRSKWIESLEL